MAKSTRQVPGTMTEVDLESGAETVKPMAWDIIPPAKGKCAICAVDHPPEDPHNAQSLFYQMAFNGIVGRSPTWADAMAHCSDEVKKAWKALLQEKDAWSEPPAGEQPVRHHGVE